MPDFTIKPSLIWIDRASTLSAKWPHADERIRRIIGYEMQSFYFHKALIEQVCSINEGHTHTFANPLDFTLRAGLAKSTVASGVSILEVVLLNYGRKLSYIKPEDEKRSPLGFGGIIEKWLLCGGKLYKPNSQSPFDPRPYIKPIFEDLHRLWAARNNIHLYKATSTPERFYEDVIPRTEEEIEAVERCIKYLQSTPPC